MPETRFKHKNQRGRGYEDVSKLYESVVEMDTPFSPHIKRLQAKGEYLPAYIMRKPLLNNITEAQIKYYQGQIGKILGVHDIASELKKAMGDEGILDAENTRAGWGHGFEAQAQGDGASSIFDIPILRFIGEQIAGRHGNSYKMKSTAHGAVHKGTNLLAEMTNADLIHDFIKDNIRVWLAMQAFGLAGLGDGGKNKKQGIDPLSTLAQHPSIFKYILDAAYYINWRAFDRRMIEALDIFRDKMHVMGGYTANVATARGLRNGKSGPHRRILSHIVDPGYCRNEDGTWTAMNLLEFVDQGGPIGVPDDTTRQILAHYFGITDSFVVGDNVGQMVDHELVLNKWKDITRHRFVLGSTSGHGANIGELSEMVDNYQTYQKEHNGSSPYTCAIFIGDHKEGPLHPHMSSLVQKAQEANAVEITASWEKPFDEFKKEVLSHKGKLMLIRAEDSQLVSIAKLWLQQIANIEAVKPGEAHVINPHVATATYLLTPSPPNEPLNGIAALLKGGSIARSQKWGDYLKAYFKQLDYPDERINQIIQNIPGLKPQKENIFEALDDLWDTVKQQAMKGFVEMDNATVPLLAMELAPILGKSLSNRHGQDVRDNIARFLKEERERKKNVVMHQFPDVAQKIFPDLAEEKLRDENHKVLGCLALALTFISGGIAGYLLAQMKKKT